MNMLDSRYLSVAPRFQPVGNSFYTTRIVVMQKRIIEVTDEFSGDMGTNQIEYVPIVRSWPAAITPRSEENEMAMAGQTERGELILTCPYRVLSTGRLLIKERDIIIDMSTRQQYLVLWSLDPMNTHSHIYAEVQHGVIDKDLREQG